VNKKLGEKFEISEVELVSTVDACKSLLLEGEDIDTGAAATQVRHAHTLMHPTCGTCCSVDVYDQIGAISNGSPVVLTMHQAL
jgi:hypothetical protein